MPTTKSAANRCTTDTLPLAPATCVNTDRNGPAQPAGHSQRVGAIRQPPGLGSNVQLSRADYRPRHRFGVGRGEFKVRSHGSGTSTKS